MNFSNKTHYLVVAIFIAFPLSFVTTYIIALSRKDIVPFFAYISDTGTHSPQSCIFAQLLNIVALLMGFVVYVRYIQVQEFYKNATERSDASKQNKINVVSLVLGMIAALGVSVVGCFQELNAPLVHIIGAFMCFLGGSIYLLFQSYFSFKLLPMFGTKPLAILRTILASTCFILFFVTHINGVISLKSFTGDDITKWKPEHGGWGHHVTSVTCEWIMAAVFDAFLLTLVVDFKKISVEKPKMRFTHIERGGGQGDKKAVPMLPVKHDD